MITHPYESYDLTHHWHMFHFHVRFLATETERKISREELTHIQKDIESEFGTLKKLMDIKEKADKKRKESLMTSSLRNTY